MPVLLRSGGGFAPWCGLLLGAWLSVPGVVRAGDDVDTPAAEIAKPADPVTAELQFQRAARAFEERRYAEALEILEQMPQRSPAAEYYRGLCLLRLKRPAEAAVVLQAIRDNPDAPSELNLDAAIASLHAGKNVEATEGLLEFVQDEPDDAQGRYFLGLSLLKQGSDEAGQAQLEIAFQDESMAPYRDFYNQRLAPLPPRAFQPSLGKGDRRWNLTVLTGYEHDSNVPLLPYITGLGSGSGRDDSRWQIGMQGDYRLRSEGDFNWGVYGSTFNTFQFELHQFDVQNYGGGSYASTRVGEWFMSGNYQFNETLLDSQQFATDHRMNLAGTHALGDIGPATVYYEYEIIDLDAQALIPAQFRSATVHSIGFTQALTLGPEDQVGVFVGYRFDEADARGSDFDMLSHMVSTRVAYALADDLLVDAEFRHFWDDYEHPNSLDFFERPRSDERLELRVGLQKLLNERTRLRLDYSYIDSDSNVRNLFDVGFYSYRRHVLSTQVIYDF